MWLRRYFPHREQPETFAELVLDYLAATVPAPRTGPSSAA
jgi:hypothetical protein